jgi:APA family basic amino acid/polyamine antiporter
LLRGIFQIKKLDDIMASAESGPTLRRDLGAFQVTLLGIGAIVGAGIFATLGTAAAGDAQRLGAGPSLMLSFVITAVVCAFTALCYAEFAALVPISGSAYTYSYATLGELVAWIIGWDLIIEYAVGNVAVAISWANYFRTLLESIGIHFPLWLATDFRTASHTPELLASAPHVLGVPIVFNLLAFLIVALITVVLVVGIRESARFNAVMVMIKIIVLLFFVVVALKYVTPSTVTANWHPFQPTGWKGTFAGAAVVFFAYIGFDAVSTVSEETRNPGRNLPIGIIASLVICTVLYIGVAAVFTGIMPYAVLKQKLATEQAEPLTMALAYVMGGQQKWVIGLVALGSVIAHTAVLLVFQLGQPRIFFSMARDGLLPQSFARVHPRFRTPHVTTILTGVLVGGVAAFASIDEMVDLTNIGTLFAFVLVCVGVPILRHTNPNAQRPFRVPFGPYLLPLLGAASCVFLMYYLPPASWWRFVGWLVLGFAIYSAYGYTRSTIGLGLGRPRVTPWTLKVASLGFLLTACGLFTIPHSAGLGTLISQAGDALAADHSRSLAGLSLIVVGLVLGAAGLLIETRDRRTA